MADTSKTQLAYIAETVYGTTPATPVFKLMRFTNENILPNVQYLTSDEIRPDRNVPDLTQVGGDAGGDIGLEMSYGSFDDFIEALLGGTWATNVLKNDVTERSFTIEKKFETGVTDQYHRLTGARVNTFNLRMAAREKITGSFGLMGKTVSTGTTAISGATYTAANTNPIMNAASMFQTLTMSGITNPELLSLDLNITNNMRQQPVMGQIGSKGVGAGRFEVNGSFEAYFANSEIVDAYVNNTATTLNFTIGGTSSLKYALAMAKVKFSGVEVSTPGNDQDVIARVNFQAYYDATEAASLKITRTP
ncbi:MAG: phage tail protein [Micavibrio aeruginosavorus]|uniref:Phage tail protein n=1 Tax=Micavibrio aeruginosavorus TaxID=349221 RepID=A0A2W5N169_9BACT|nr:MAG: phage tail protein [Micavibrio aeruginosavorus]